MDAPQSLPDRLDALDRKLARLLRDHRALREENHQLMEERRTLRQTIDRQREENQALKEQIKQSPLLSGLPTGADGAKLRTRLDEYIQEIDRCIEHLSE